MPLIEEAKHNEEPDLEVNDDEELAELLEKNCLIPFDVQCTYSDTILTFGPLGSGELIGKFAQCLVKQKIEQETEQGLDIDDEDNFSIDIHRVVGYIVGHKNGRIVLDLDDAYLGWLSPHEFKLVNVHNTTPYIQ